MAVIAGALLSSASLQFLCGGMLVNIGYRMQDHLHAFDVQHAETTPQQVWSALLAHNELASKVRSYFPRSVLHPEVALVVCMDARIDTTELMGDTRRYYYIVRTAGSALGPEEQEMLELAVQKGVHVLVLTTHSDCAAEHVAKDPVLRRQFPALAQQIDLREQRIAEFMERPLIRAKVKAGALLIKRMVVNTSDEHFLPPAQAHSAADLGS